MHAPFQFDSRVIACVWLATRLLVVLSTHAILCNNSYTYELCPCNGNTCLQQLTSIEVTVLQVMLLVHSDVDVTERSVGILWLSGKYLSYMYGSGLSIQKLMVINVCCWSSCTLACLSRQDFIQRQKLERGKVQQVSGHMCSTYSLWRALVDVCQEIAWCLQTVLHKI